MARFFKKLEAEGGARGPQFFSDHPNPGNRMKAIQDEIRYMPKRSYNADTGQLVRMKAIVATLPPPKKKPAQAAGASAPLSLPESRPSGRMQQYQGKEFSLSHPDNWKPFNSQNSAGVTIVPPAGVQDSQEGTIVGYGAILNYYKPRQANASLAQATNEFVSQLRSADPRMRVSQEAPKEVSFGGKNGLLTTLYSDSIFPGQTEVDLLVTVPHPNGILFIVCIAPEGEGQYSTRAFDEMLHSMRFSF
jgi:hypothetical protein